MRKLFLIAFLFCAYTLLGYVSKAYNGNNFNVEEESVEIILYPNPVTTHLYIEYPGGPEVLIYSLYDAHGRSYDDIEQGRIGDCYFLYVGALDSGTYFIQIEEHPAQAFMIE